MMKFRLALLLTCSAALLHAQRDTTSRSIPPAPAPPPPTAKAEKPKARGYEVADGKAFAETIKAEDLKALLDVLASNEMQGRETGQPGQRKAADFIAKQFKDAGFEPVGDRNTYFQQILLANNSWTDIGLKVGEKEFKNKTDFYVFPSFNPDMPLLSLKEVVFVGFGIEDAKYNDYGKADVEGKAVILYDGEPLDEKGYSLITGTQWRSDWSVNWKKKVQLAKKKGAAMVFIVDSKFDENIKANRKLISSYGWKPVSPESEAEANTFINNIFISPETAKAILGSKAGKAEDEMADLRKGDKFKPVKLKTKIEVRLHKETKHLEGSNVLAVVEGSDERLKKEFVLVTAHYDHLGMADSTVIYHGADDNASGTSGVIEIARAFAEAKKQGKGPKRSVVFMLVSGEEKGLLGSRYYVEFPMFPLKQTIADINIDMIGRIDDAHASNPNYIYSIGSDRISPDLKEISEYNNQKYTQLEINYKYDAKDDPNHYYERSDHYNFAERGIPVIFYFNGTHADYHRPTDTADKIDFNTQAKRAKLAFYTAWEVANRPYGLSTPPKR
jgi:hypothetical protein